MAAANDDALAVAAAQGVRGLTGGESPDSAAAAADQQALSRLRAQLALRGHYLHCTSSGYMVACGGWTTELVDLAAVRGFVKRIGGAA